MKITRYYLVVCEIPLVDGQNEVNDCIENGWQPYGDPLIIVNPAGGATFIQPMVKYEKSND